MCATGQAPLNKDEDVSTHTVIGKGARGLMDMESSVFISHMSFGAFSGRVKIALDKGSVMAGTAISSAEGGAVHGCAFF